MMSESTTGPRSEAPSNPADQHEMLNTEERPATPSYGVFRWRVVMTALLIAVGIFAGVLIYEVYLGGHEFIFSLGRPPIVAAKGRVFYNGEPLTVGYVETQPLNHELKGSSGRLDENGEFQLATATRTDDVDGAYLGTHKVGVMVFSDEIFPMPLLPEYYTDLVNTPLTLKVTKDPTNNTFVLKLSGEMELPTRRRPSVGARKGVRGPRKMNAARKPIPSTSAGISNPILP